MKLEKKHYVIIGIVLVAIAIWYFFLRKKKPESNYKRQLPFLKKIPVSRSSVGCDQTACDNFCGCAGCGDCAGGGCGCTEVKVPASFL
jgi:LPXTG-motif cell wall-anchored protein